MDYLRSDRTGNDKPLQIHIYDRKLQLDFSGKYHPEHRKQMEHKLSRCYLLFNVDNTGYFIRKA
jgi:hypothetical protein